MNKKRIILSLPFLALSSCTQSVAISSGITSKDLADAHDLASCFSLLARCNDMTMNVVHDSKSSYLDYNRYYTPTYIYDAEEKNEWGYVLGKNGVFSISKDYGVFSISKDHGVFVSSELLTDKDGKSYSDVYSLAKGFSSLTNEFDAGTTRRAFNRKSNKLFLLSLVNLSPTEYDNLETANATMGDDIYSLNINLIVKDGGSYTISFLDFFSAHATDLETYLSNGAKELVPNENLSSARDLFKANNYDREVLNFESGASEGTEHFLPTYFYGAYTTSVSWGLMGIDDYYVKTAVSSSSSTSVQELELFGSYMFTLSGSSVSLSAAKPYNVSPNIPSKDVYNYPSNLLLWSSMEFLHEDYLGQQYTTDRPSVLNDFVKNYQLSDILKNSNAIATSLKVDLDGFDENKPCVTFKLSYSQGTAKGTIKFPMKDFGKANVAAVDRFMATSLYRK